MATNRPAARYRQIVEACETILAYTEGYDRERYLGDRKTQDAVERQLLKIAEAAARLDELAEADLPDQPWRQIRGLGNRLRHEYDNIDGALIWALIDGGGLEALRQAVATHLASTAQ